MFTTLDCTFVFQCIRGYSVTNTRLVTHFWRYKKIYRWPLCIKIIIAMISLNHKVLFVRIGNISNLVYLLRTFISKSDCSLCFYSRDKRSQRSEVNHIWKRENWIFRNRNFDFWSYTSDDNLSRLLTLPITIHCQLIYTKHIYIFS